MFLFKDIGITIKQSKTVLPSISLTFFGIELDSVVRKAIHLIQTYKARKTVTLQELQSIIGVLKFACSVVIPGRPYLRRLCDLTIDLIQPYHHLNSEARSDLKAWSIFLNCFNSKSLFLSDQCENSVSLQLYNDASNIGFGDYLGNQYFSGVWSKAWEAYHIISYCTCSAALGKAVRKSMHCFFTDNDAVAWAINRQTF